MGTLDENLARWVFSSIAEYHNTVATGLSLPLLVEGVDERSQETMQVDHAELRVNGPEVREVSHGYWRVYVDVNILLTDRMAMSVEDAYAIARWGGKFLQAAVEPIPVYKYGPDGGGVDDGSLIGCLVLRRSPGESARLIHFGQIGREDRIRQAMVDCRYEMYLEM